MYRIQPLLLILLLSFWSCTDPPNKKPDPPVGQFVYGGPANELANSILELSNGDLLVTGGVQDEKTDEYDVLLMRIAADGTEIWTKTFGETGLDEQGLRVIPFQGGYVLMGVTAINWESAKSIQLFELDSNFDLIESHLYVMPNSAFSRSNLAEIFETQDGGFLVGISIPNGSYMIKLDANFDKEWDITYPESYSTGGAIALTQLASGGFAFATGGSQGYYYYGSAITLYRLDENGNSLWANAIGPLSSNYVRVAGVEEDISGYFVLNIQDVGARSTYQVRSDSLGSVIWEAQRDRFELSRIKRTTSGDFLSVGYLGSFWNEASSRTDGYLTRTTSDGIQNLVINFRGDDTDRMHDIIETSDGKLICVGMTMSYGAGGSDVFLSITQP